MTKPTSMEGLDFVETYRGFDIWKLSSVEEPNCLVVKDGKTLHTTKRRDLFMLLDFNNELYGLFECDDPWYLPEETRIAIDAYLIDNQKLNKRARERQLKKDAIKFLTEQHKKV